MSGGAADRAKTRKPRTSLTIYDVARHAGLSIASVSRVLNRCGNPRSETRDRVMQAVLELSYVRDGAARALSAGLKEVVGVVFRRGEEAGFEDEAESPLFDDIVTRGIEASAQRSGFDVLISMAGVDDAPSRLPALAGKTDGLVLHDRLLSATALAHLAELLPVVTLGGRPAPGTMSVRCDNDAGIRALVRHLVADHGYRTLAYLSGHADSPDSQARAAALEREAKDASARVLAGPRWTGDYSAAGGARVISALLADGGRLPRAIVCANDQTALGVMHALAQRGIRVPEDVAVTGFDDVAVARHLHPTLTTVHQPIREMGETAFDLLHASIMGRSHVEPDVVLPVQLVVRDSCGCARRGGKA
ncbi:MAG: LacI family DNA-binding transcriptional regulator [Candidatus Dormibacteria bacterium]